MSERSIDCFVIDIVLTLARLKKNAKMCSSVQDLLHNDNLCDAILRQLEVLGEAANNILKSEKYCNHVNREWRKIVNFRNIVAHEYFGIDYEIVFDILQHKITSFDKEILVLITQFSSCRSLKQALIDAQLELERAGKIESMLYLRDLEKLFK